jgi:two-component system, NarL family, nitrate/nitrite response regulator NarL
MDGFAHPLKIVIVLAVGVRLYREGLATLLAGDDRLTVQTTVSTSEEAISACLEQPDVALIDVGLDDAIDLIRSVRQQCPGISILVFAVREDLETILTYAEAGADGFVTANGTVGELISAIERVKAGELLCSPRIAAQLLRQAARSADRSPVASAGLTSREEQVLLLLKQGRSNKEIAGTLCIAEATVKNHVHRVLEKLQVSTRAKAAAAGLRMAKAT